MTLIERINQVSPSSKEDIFDIVKRMCRQAFEDGVALGKLPTVGGAIKFEDWWEYNKNYLPKTIGEVK